MSSTETLYNEEYDDEEVIEAVEELYEAGETELAGGVHFRTVAAELDRPITSMRSKLSALAESGDLKRTYGIADAGKVWTYAPVSDDDRLVTDGGSVVDETESARPRVIQSCDVDLRIALRDDEVPYSAQVNDGPRFSDWTALEAVRRALNHSDDVDLPAATELSGGGRDDV